MERIIEEAKWKGYRKHDSAIVAEAKTLRKLNKNLLDSISEFSNERERNAYLEMYLHTNNYHLEDYQQFFTIGELKTLSNSEIKQLLSLYELNALNKLGSVLGADVVHLDQVELIIIPDSYFNKSNILKGKLVFAANSKKVGDLAEYYLDGELLEIRDGHGYINRRIPSDKTEVELIVKFSEYEYKQTINLK